MIWRNITIDPTRPTPALAVPIAGQEIWLLADKALYWPAGEALLIADIHFGKAAAYRALGQPVPQGTTTNNLQRLDALLAQYPCRQLIFLGDFLHARRSHAPATLAALHAWRERNAELEILLIRGNHDRSAGDPPSTLDIRVVAEPYLLARSPCNTNPTHTPATMCWPAMCTRCAYCAGADGSGCACPASAWTTACACCRHSAPSLAACRSRPCRGGACTPWATAACGRFSSRLQVE